MIVSSFDIFDTCLVRLCGTPAHFFDVFSFQAFSAPVSESLRQRFVAERREAEHQATVRFGAKATLLDIYDQLTFTHPHLLTKKQLMDAEINCERSMLLPVLSMKRKVDDCRKKGHHIIFISDMYLPSWFLKEVMTRFGFFKVGDSLYVSCEVGLTKYKGRLFDFVLKNEKLSKRKWTHYGDNRYGDIQGARFAGLKAQRIEHAYSPIQKLWSLKDYVNGFKYPGVMAGISRALCCSNEDNSHKHMVVDLITPLVCSFTYGVMKAASEKHFSRLFFCARDTYSMYQVAQKMKPMFPDLEIDYLYISREALYEGEDEGKLAYFQQIGLASRNEDVAIVDFVTGGKTMMVLNRLLQNNGYRKVYGYFLYKWEHFDIEVDFDYCHFELSQAYLKGSAFEPFIFLIRTQFFENFFGMNDQKRTVGYVKSGDKYEPVFTESTIQQDGNIPNRKQWLIVHQSLIDQFADAFLATGLYRYSEDVFKNLVMNALVYFSSTPDRIYLEPMLEYRITEDGIPMVKKKSLIGLVLTCGRDSEWRRGTFYFNLSKWLMSLIVRLLQ